MEEIRPPERPPERISEIKQRLFSRNEKLWPKKREWTFHKKTFAVGSAWATKAKDSLSRPPKSPALFKKFFLGAVIFSVVAAGFAAIMLLGGDTAVSTERVKILITGNAFTAGGEELPLVISVTNENNVGIDSSELLVEYPRGSENSSEADYERKRITLGDIAAGEEKNESISLLLYGEQGSTKEIKARLEYRVRGSNATFTKEVTYTVNINTAPVALQVDAPTDLVSNQDLKFNIQAVVSAATIGENAVVKVDYPPGFQFYNSTPKAILGNNIFTLDKKEVGAINTITINGTVIGVDGDKKAFRVAVGERDQYDQSKIAVTYNSFVHELAIAKPFIDARIVVDDVESDTYTIDSQQKVNAQILWSNNLPTRVDGLQIQAKIYGNALNKTSINGSGFYDSNTDTISWDQGTLTALASVEPGEHGKIPFQFSSLSLLSGSQSVIADPSITIELSIKGRQPLQGIANKEVKSFKKIVFKVNTNLQLGASAVYSTGPINNTGPIPPKVGTETTYTVTWRITNTGNRATDGTVIAILPANMRYIAAEANSNENVSYNETTREVTWRPGTIARGTGFVVSARMASFQLGLTPSLSQVGSTPVLLGEATLTAKDAYTSENLHVTAPKVNTKLTADPAFPLNGDKVVD